MKPLTFRKTRHGSFDKYEVHAIRIAGKDEGFISPIQGRWYWYAFGVNTLQRLKLRTFCTVDEAKADVKLFLKNAPLPPNPPR